MIDLDPAAGRLRDDGSPLATGVPSRPAIAAAVLFHVAVVLLLLTDWRIAPPPEPEVIPIRLVMERPPEPPPPAAPEQPRQPSPLSERQSGTDERTTAPPAAPTPAPEPVAPTPPPGLPAEPEPEPATAEAPAGGNPAPPHPPVPHTEPRKEAALPRAPAPRPRLDNRALGEKEETGDPYLNEVWAMIERNRAPTTPIGSSGLHLEGIAIYEVSIDRSGRLRSIELSRTSGAPQLDDEGRRMIAAASPLPPLPAAYPDPAHFTITIRLYPQ